MNFENFLKNSPKILRAVVKFKGGCWVGVGLGGRGWVVGWAGGWVGGWVGGWGVGGWGCQPQTLNPNPKP